MDEITVISLPLSIVFVKREKLQFVSEAGAGFECHRTGKKLRGCVPVTTRIVNDRIRTQPRFEKGYNEPETRYIETITLSLRPSTKRTKIRVSLFVANDRAQFKHIEFGKMYQFNFERNLTFFNSSRRGRRCITMTYDSTGIC